MVKLQTHEHQKFSYPEKSKKWLEKDGWTGAFLLSFLLLHPKLTRHEEGSGIGRDQQGIKQCIKTNKVQQGNAGIGSTGGDGGDTGWWNDLFMMSARKLKRKRDEVDNKEDDANVDRVADTPSAVVATKRKSSRVVDELCPLYSRFTRGKHTHLVEETEKLEKTVIVEDDGSTSTVVTRTTTTTTTDSEVLHTTFEACDRKAGRYLMPEAKLARIAAQDAQFNNRSEPTEQATRLAKITQRLARRKEKAAKRKEKAKKKSKKQKKKSKK